VVISYLFDAALQYRFDSFQISVAKVKRKGRDYMQDKPEGLPPTQPNGERLKSILDVALDRRATMHFTSDPVSEEYLDAILLLAAQAPSGYNLQPWRFVVVREEEKASSVVALPGRKQLTAAVDSRTSKPQTWHCLKRGC
jgi:hypothetical protein